MEIGRELNRMRQCTGRFCLVERRLCVQEQSRRAGHQRRAEGGPRSAAVSSAGESADDIFAGRGDPNVGRAVIGKGGACVPIRCRSDAHHLTVDGCRVHRRAGAFIAGRGN